MPNRSTRVLKLIQALYASGNYADDFTDLFVDLLASDSVDFKTLSDALSDAKDLVDDAMEEAR